MISLVIAWVILAAFVTTMVYSAWQHDEGRIFLFCLVLSVSVVWALVTVVRYHVTS